MTALLETALSTRPPASVPWYVWCSVVAVTAEMIGLHWDVAWHASIGRDSFWTPAHMAIYLSGLLTGAVCGYLILSSSLLQARPGCVAVFGLRGPIGAFVGAWGCLAMLVSAPFDNWWHEAYGVDIAIVTPPHLVLFCGVVGIAAGHLLLTLAALNRASEKTRVKLECTFLYVGGLLLVLQMLILIEYGDRTILHSARPYRAIAAPVPLVIAAVWRASHTRFAASIAAGVYTLFNIALILILPLFPAQPRLGPVYTEVTHFIPPQFPILLIAPAFVLDLLWQRGAGWKPSILAVLSGLLFVSALVAAEWPFADFLMSPASRNAFFGTGYMSYLVQPDSHIARGAFQQIDSGLAFFRHLAWAVVIAAFSTRMGMSLGGWMRTVRR